MDREILGTVIRIGIPSSIQAILINALLPVVDMVMVSGYGESVVSAVGTGSKVMLLVTSVLGCVSTLTGIMVAQYLGNKDKDSIDTSVSLNMLVSLALAGLAMALCILFPSGIMQIFVKDPIVIDAGSEYLWILSFSFIPLAVQNITASILRCYEKAMPLLVTGIISTIVNISLNSILIPGRLGFPELGIKGAALASAIAAVTGCVLLIMYYYLTKGERPHLVPVKIRISKKFFNQYIRALIGMSLVGILFSLSENVYSVIYGHMDVHSYSAYCILTSMTGIAFSLIVGIQAATAVIVGKYMGQGNFNKVYSSSKELLTYILIASVVISISIIIFHDTFINLFTIDNEVEYLLVRGLVLSFSLIFPVMALNMVLSNSILKAGGKVYTPLLIDIIGMWCIGVPTALICVKVLGLSVIATYLLVAIEQVVRLLLCLVVFRRKKFMRILEVSYAKT